MASASKCPILKVWSHLEHKALKGLGLLNATSGLSNTHTNNIITAEWFRESMFTPLCFLSPCAADYLKCGFELKKNTHRVNFLVFSQKKVTKLIYLLFLCFFLYRRYFYRVLLSLGLNLNLSDLSLMSELKTYPFGM